MKNLANFLLFQAGWFACVVAAASGRVWLGPLAVILIVALHLRFIANPKERRWELRYIVVVGLLGMIADTGLGVLGATHYPTSEPVWSSVLAPPWITALWVLFGTLPRHSLGWLQGRPGLAVILGAIAGPLSYLAGTRFGAVEVGDSPLLSLSALAFEYALVTPLLLHFAQRDP